MADESRIVAKKARNKSRSRSQRAGLLFPVSRVHQSLRRGNYGIRCGSNSATYVAAVLEYLTAEIIEISGNCAKDHKKKRINPRHINLAIQMDAELNQLFDGVTVPGGGVVPNPMYAKAKKEESVKEEKK
jgi:histone H2A